MCVCLGHTTNFATDAAQAEDKMECWQTLVDVSNLLHSANMPYRLLYLIFIDGVPTRQHHMVSQPIRMTKLQIVNGSARSGMVPRARMCKQGSTSMEPCLSTEQWYQAAYSLGVEPTESFGGYIQQCRPPQRLTQGSCI